MRTVYTANRNPKQPKGPFQDIIIIIWLALSPKRCQFIPPGSIPRPFLIMEQQGISACRTTCVEGDAVALSPSKWHAWQQGCPRPLSRGASLTGENGHTHTHTGVHMNAFGTHR